MSGRNVDCRAASVPDTVAAPAVRPAWGQRQQVIALVVMAALAVAMTAALWPSHAAFYRRFFGPLPALWVVAFGCAAGGLALVHLMRAHDSLPVVRGGASLRGMAVATVVAIPLAAVAVLADVLLRFPADINLPPPAALLFYPAIAFVVEMFFHALPMALLTLVHRAPWHSRAGLAAVALLEPAFQLVLAPRLLAATTLFTALQVLVINVAQLLIWRRHDFVSMLWLRLVYYAGWHIVWGLLRLQWLAW